MNVLVLGGNGFIGSHLVDALLRKGVRVRVFDRSADCHNRMHSNIEYHIGSFNDSAQMAEALQDIDLVYHLISTSVPSTSNLDPVADIKGNLIGTVQLLQQMVQLNVKRILYLSSGGTVYGNPSVENVSEKHPLRPICSYGVIKVAIENYIHMFEQLYGIEPIVLRPSNPYGPRQGHVGVQGVIPTFLKRLIDHEPIQIWGDGSVVRDYLYIDDLISLCIKAGFSEGTGTFNAGSGIGYSLNELLSVIQKISGEKLDVKYLAGRSFDVKKITLDIENAQNEFSWKPEISIEDGIAMYWNWLVNIMQL
jgi:UDP-glucose 4-epimerase